VLQQPAQLDRLANMRRRDEQAVKTLSRQGHQRPQRAVDLDHFGGGAELR
jgi:hypothetical protein